MSLCPFLKKKCIQHKCALYSHLLGMNPQTGQPSDHWGCSLALLPLLLVENTNMIRQDTASVDKTANQVNKLRAEIIGAMSDEARARLEMSKPELLSNNGNH